MMRSWMVELNFLKDATKQYDINMFCLFETNYKCDCACMLLAVCSARPKGVVWETKWRFHSILAVAKNAKSYFTAK